jgi:ornithine decarboxylase
MPAAAESLSIVPTTRLDCFLAETRPATPCLVLDLDVVRARYIALLQSLPKAEIYYAVKANPAVEVVAALAALGANFDLASPGEIEICKDLGIAATRLSFGNTVKRESAIAGAEDDGIGLFAFDSAAELDKLARRASGARVFCRMLVENKGAEWPLTRKFGGEAHMAAESS